MLMHQRQQSMHSLRANPAADDENAIDEDDTVMSRGQLPEKEGSITIETGETGGNSGLVLHSVSDWSSDREQVAEMLDEIDLAI